MAAKTRKAFRQGELLFVPLTEADLKTLNFDPDGKGSYLWNKLPTNVIREGEATGHKHEVIEKEPQTATLYTPARTFMRGLEDMDSIGAEDRMLAVKEPVEIVHPEHGRLNLRVGFFLIVIQREYDEAKVHRIMD